PPNKDWPPSELDVQSRTPHVQPWILLGIAQLRMTDVNPARFDRDAGRYLHSHRQPWLEQDPAPQFDIPPAVADLPGRAIVNDDAHFRPDIDRAPAQLPA